MFQAYCNISVPVNPVGKKSISTMHTTNYIIRLSSFTSDQKLYTEFWISPLSFCLWLGGINSIFNSHLDKKSQERFYNQIVSKYKCSRRKIVDKDVLITYRFSHRKFTQYIITTRDLPQEPGIWNSSKLFHKLLANVMWIKSLSKTVRWNGNLLQKSSKSFLTMPFHLLFFISIKSLYQKFCWT